MYKLEKRSEEQITYRNKQTNKQTNVKQKILKNWKEGKISQFHNSVS